MYLNMGYSAYTSMYIHMDNNILFRLQRKLALINRNSSATDLIKITVFL